MKRFFFCVLQALELDASNEKALFRRGDALFGMKEFDKAKDDFQLVVQLYPANKAAKSQVRVHSILLQHQKVFAQEKTMTRFPGATKRTKLDSLCKYHLV